MAWTTPRTWVDLEFVDEDDLNEQIRDNMDYLYTAASEGGLIPFLLMGA